MAMQSIDIDLYQIAVILPLKRDYETAAKCLDQVFLRSSLQSTGAEYTLGRAGLHHVVLVTGLDSTSAPDSVAAVYPDLVQAFSSIRVGFLVGVDAIAPYVGCAKAGDVVVGLPQSHESGIAHCDLDKSRDQKRLCITGNWGKPPGFVQSAVDHTLSSQCLPTWYEYLDKHSSTLACPDESLEDDPARNQVGLKEFTPSLNSPPRFNLAKWAPNIIKGRIGSSSQPLSGSELFHNPADDDGILCFETAAANLQGPLPLLVVCGVGEADTPSLPREHAIHASKVASVYTMFLAGHLNALQLTRRHRLGNIYHHRPFCLERPAFRLLRLERGTSLPIQCSIFEAYLDQADTPIDYEALSYAWGNSEKSEVVIVNKRVLPVTENLYMALQHLRQEHIDRILWVDAVCIDQSNVAERGHQVTYMGSIYERADNVIVWLGSASENAGLLISALNTLQHQTSSQVFRTSKRTDAVWRDIWDKIQEKSSPSQTVHHLTYGLQELTGKSWFTRVWILQEVAKARRAQIHCTAGIVDAKLFALAPWLLRVQVPPRCQAILDIMPGPSRQSSWWSKERTLRELLWRFWECQATDPRDRVYALLGISSIADESIKPDYSKSERQVVRDVCDHLFGSLEAPIDLSLIYSITQLQEELNILSIISPGGLARSLNRQGHVKWANGIRKLAVKGLGRSSLAFLLTRLDAAPNVAPRLLHEGVPLRKDTLATLLAPTLEADWGDNAGTSLIAIRVGKDTLHLLFPDGQPESSVCSSILNEAILAGEKTFSFSISGLKPTPERLKKFLYNSIPDIEILEEKPYLRDF
ncbi:hypothetical protein LCI18_010226 [Fusarium solani-melongenae]|uniref:Uncharacterized protein n=1 Tax=Fusarium solani subsp. cucurbitae TaxID=2747967 RepID=A0ACD3ZEL0_FUSSC|nr:hypothetical protein LCI18_010226 [Fusarium solani-melongenae]